jgi:hypothetical protein
MAGRLLAGLLLAAMGVLPASAIKLKVQAEECMSYT